MVLGMVTSLPFRSCAGRFTDAELDGDVPDELDDELKSKSW